MPSDTEATNPALVLPRGSELPRYDQFDSRLCLRAFVKRALEFETAVDEIDLQHEEDKTQQRSFDELYGEIEKHLVPLNYLSSVNRHLQTTCASRFSFPKSCELSARRARLKRFTSRAINDFMLAYNSDRNNLNRFARTVVDKYLLEGRLNGLSLADDQLQTLQLLKRNLIEHRATFRNNVLKTTPLAQQAIMDAKLLGADAPGVRSPDHDTNYHNFMSHCPARDLREEVFCAHHGRAFKQDKRTNNAVVIEEIRSARRHQAQVLGYETYADLSMETKMAASVDTVKSMLNTLNAANKEQLERDLDELKDFAGDKVQKVELWDTDYLRRQYCSQHFRQALSDDTRMYFPLDRVLNGLFGLAERVFQIHVEEVPLGSWSAWHEEVRLFRVVSPNGSVGSFFFDGWARSDDKIAAAQNYSRVELLLNRSAICETRPIASWVLDLPRPLLANQQINLTFADVLRLAKGVS